MIDIDLIDGLLQVSSKHTPAFMYSQFVIKCHIIISWLDH